MNELLLIALLGASAQFINGSLGMGFGVISTSGLLATGIAPASASSIVHLVEIVTSALNGTFHSRFGNVNWPVVWKVGIPGAIGAFVGALFLSSIRIEFARPVIGVVIIGMGFAILWRFARPALEHTTRSPRARWLMPLGLGGGVLDATGGGGWGTVVTSTLTASRALTPQESIGTSTTARFIVALSGSIGFLVGLGAENIAWSYVAAMLVGAIVMAPFGPYLVRRIRARVLGVITAWVVVLLGLRQVLLGINPPSIVGWTVCAVLVAVLALGTGSAIRTQRRSEEAHK